MRKFIAAIFLIFCLTPDFSLAENNTPHWSKSRIIEEVKSPWTTKARNYLYGGTAALTTVFLFKKQLIDETQASVSTRKPLGTWSQQGDQMGQLIPNVLYMGAAYWLGETNKSMLMLKSTLYSGAITTALKFAIQEERPNGSNKHSFPSGHSTTAFAFASTVASLHEWYWGASAYALAGFVGFSRINDNMHYMQDVVAGATIGMVYGVGVVEIQKKFFQAKNKDSSTKQTSLNIMPVVDTDMYGLFGRWEF